MIPFPMRWKETSLPKSPMPPAVGCIADNYTGATDLASVFAGAGLRVLLLFEIPTAEQSRTLFPGADSSSAKPGPDAVIIARKIRSIEVDSARRQAVEALQFLQQIGCGQFYWKYCSTFDSTPSGNIGPVAEALLQALQPDYTIYAHSFPDNGREAFHHILFVHGQLLGESPMRTHPLNPITDSDLVRLLKPQCAFPVGAVDLATVQSGQAREQAETAYRDRGIRHFILDAVSNDDLRRIAPSFAPLPLLTGGSALTLGLSEVYRESGKVRGSGEPYPVAAGEGAEVSLVGSCSSATQRQISFAREHGMAVFEPDFELFHADFDRALEKSRKVFLDWKQTGGPSPQCLIHTGGDRANVEYWQQKLGSRPLL